MRRISNHRILITLTAVALGLFLGANGFAQTAADLVKFSSRVEPTDPRAGETVKVIITATIKDGYNIYGLPWYPDDKIGPKPTEIQLKESSGLIPVGAIQQQPPKKKTDAAFDNLIVHYFEKTAEFTQYLRIPEAKEAASVQVVFNVDFQVCDEESCFFGNTDVAAEFEIVAGNARKEFVGLLPPAPTEPSGEPSKGLLPFLLLAIGAGLISLLTPCVFPMIPITVSFFTKQAENKTAGPVKLALAYCLGIIVMFTVFGLLVSVLLGPNGPNMIAANPFVNLLVTIIFVVFALSLFGLFEIQAPSFITNALNRKSAATSGYVGAILMGFTFTLAAFTCTVPFAGTVLVGAARGEWFWPTVGMLAYSTTFAFPFFLLALFPRWLASLPKSGGWLNSVKVTMGFLELAAALKFLSTADFMWGWNIFTYDACLALWAVIAAFTGLYLLGAFRFSHDSKVEYLGVARVMLSMFFVAFALYFAAGLFGKDMHPWVKALLPPQEATPPNNRRSDGDKLVWHEDLQAALAEARSQRKLLFVDFTGYACSNCRLMETGVFVRPEVQSVLGQFVRVKLYIDGGPNRDFNRDYLVKKTGAAAIPYYVVMDADENVLSLDGGLMSTEKFLALLEKGLKQGAAKKAVASQK
jgi:thiol:disulfide interchange protein DsbD